MNGQKRAWLAGLLVATLAGAASPACAADGLRERGHYLAIIGDCSACHTAPGGKPLAGGRAIPSPFGTIYTPNITPDKETGIGTWTDSDFYQALHSGLAKGGAHIYPAMPYQWYTRVTRDDVMAIKAYMFSLPPVAQRNKPNELAFPFDIRAGLAAWNALYFTPGTFKPDPKASDEINRGAYLVEGLGHCGACHTPKNIAQAPIISQRFAGEAIQGWYAPNISGDVREGIGDWTVGQLVTYLKTGEAPGKAIAQGPMAETIHDSLSKLKDSDLQAIAAYLKSTPSHATYADHTVEAYRSVHAPGAQIYLSNCAICHQVDGRGDGKAVPPLVGNGAVTAGGPQDVIRAVLGGVMAHGTYGPMPAIGATMSDSEIADVTNYVRQTFGGGTPSAAGPGMVGTLRTQTRTMLANNEGSCPAVSSRTLAAALARSGSGIARDLEAIDSGNMPARVQDIVAKARTVSPTIGTATLVNDMTAAYCSAINRKKDVPSEQRVLLLNRFAELLFTEARTSLAQTTQ